MRSSRWDQFGTSIFTTMTLLARQHNAINLAQGFPDFDGPEVIKEAAIRAIREGLNQYCPSHGIPELRQLIAKRKEKTSGLKFEPESEITVFSGATEAIFSGVIAMCEPGDEVLTFEPFYDSYPQAACATGATFKAVALRAPDWTFNPEDLARAITPKTRVLLLNTPHNPTGKVFTRDELQAIADLAIKHDLIVMADEVYEELVYEPAVHIGIATLPGMSERTVTISSTSKTYSMTGWKVGYAFAAPLLTKRLRAVHQASVFCSATPLEYGMLPAFELADDYYRTLKKEYRERRDQLCDILNKNGLRCTAPSGSYFVLADYSKHSHLDDIAMAEKLTQEAKVASIPISVFFTNQEEAAKTMRYLRFGFCKSESTLNAAGEHFQKYF